MKVSSYRLGDLICIPLPFGLNQNEKDLLATEKAKKTAKDLAALYQIPIHFSTAKWMTYPFNEGEI